MRSGALTGLQTILQAVKAGSPLREASWYNALQHVNCLHSSNDPLTHQAFSRGQFSSTSSVWQRRPYLVAVPHPNELETDEESQANAGLSEETGAVPVERQKLLQAGVVGVPNAGKSTLVNQLIGSKISAVSPKTNTTISTTLGAFTAGDSQVVLHDTPGVVDSLHVPNKGTKQYKRVRSAWATARGCDLLTLVVDAHRQTDQPDPRVERMVEELRSPNKLGDNAPPLLLVLNKMDKIKGNDQERFRKVVEKLTSLQRFEKVFQISAIKPDSVLPLKQYLIERAKPGEWILDAKQNSELSRVQLVTEILREKVFLRMRQELPYTTEISPLEYKSLQDGSLYFRHLIRLPSESAKAVLIGKKGSNMMYIENAARQELAELFNKKVHLYLNVRASK